MEQRANKNHKFLAFKSVLTLNRFPIFTRFGTM